MINICAPYYKTTISIGFWFSKIYPSPARQLVKVFCNVFEIHEEMEDRELIEVLQCVFEASMSHLLLFNFLSPHVNVKTIAKISLSEKYMVKTRTKNGG